MAQLLITTQRPSDVSRPACPQPVVLRPRAAAVQRQRRRAEHHVSRAGRHARRTVDPPVRPVHLQVQEGRSDQRISKFQCVLRSPKLHGRGRSVRELRVSCRPAAVSHGVGDAVRLRK